MPGTAIGIVPLQGYPGQYSRNGDCQIFARPVNSTDTYVINFGDAVFLTTDATVLGSGAYSSTQSLVAASVVPTFATFIGVAVREVKTMLAYYPAGSYGSYSLGQECDALERGSCSVVCHVGTPVSGGAVYLRTALNGGIPAGVIGGFEANSDGGNSFAVTNAFWTTGLQDSNLVAEITLVSRHLP
jgi:hypothetical protein